MAKNLILVDEKDPVTTVVTLNRPEKRNALNVAILEALIAAVEQAQADPQRRALLLQAAGPVFCAGLDLQEARDPAIAERSAELVAKALQTLAQTRLVTIAAVQGPAMAGGAGIMTACDLAVIAEGAQIGYPEVHRGLVAGLVMNFLCKQIGQRGARELLLLGRPISARRAYELGLVNRVVPAEMVQHTALELAAQVRHGGPEALARTKRLLDEVAAHPLTRDLENALRHHVEARNSAEAQEGLRAFFEKRPPSWQS